MNIEITALESMNEHIDKLMDILEEKTIGNLEIRHWSFYIKWKALNKKILMIKTKSISNMVCRF